MPDILPDSLAPLVGKMVPAEGEGALWVGRGFREGRLAPPTQASPPSLLASARAGKKSPSTQPWGVGAMLTWRQARKQSPFSENGGFRGKGEAEKGRKGAFDAHHVCRIEYD